MTLKKLIVPVLIVTIMVVMVIALVIVVRTGSTRDWGEIKNGYFTANLKEWSGNVPLADSEFRVYLKQTAPSPQDYGLIANLYPDTPTRLSFLGDSILIMAGPSEMEDVFLKLPPTALGRNDFNFRDSDSPFYVRKWPSYAVDSVGPLTAYICTVPNWPRMRALRLRDVYRETTTFWSGFLFGPADSLSMEPLVSDTIKLTVYWTGESRPRRIDLIHGASGSGAFTYELPAGE